MHDLAMTPVVIQYSGLTRPQDDLSRVLRDLTLLLIFRFVRIITCYMSPSGHRSARHYTEVPLDVFLLGQIVAYCPAEGRTPAHLDAHLRRGTLSHSD